jgi:hypothetical protein
VSAFNVSAYLRKGEAGRLINVLSIFVHPVTFNEENLDEAIVPWLSGGGPYDRVHICGQPSSVATTRDIFSRDSAVRSRMQKMLKNLDQHVIFITWLSDRAGLLVETLQGTLPNDTGVAMLEQRFSLCEAFLKNGGLVTAGRGTHFTKPSGTHSIQFLRAANVLEKSATSHQLVFWLYPLVQGRTINRLVVDTSGIAPVAYALAYERLRCGAAAVMPMIESHASYGGLDALTVPDPGHTVFLISASTSGSLASKLIEKGAKPENVFTLFYLGASTQGTVICHLREDKAAQFAGIPMIANYQVGNCPECSQHSYPIPIVGDQFRTEPAKVDEIDVALSDFDEASRAVLDRLVSTGLFRVFRAVGTRRFELYLDVQTMLEGSIQEASAQERVEDIRTRLGRLIRRGTTVHLRRIIPTSYPGMARIARDEHATLPAQLNTQSLLTVSRDLASAGEVLNAATLVLSACMDDTYELMGISRDLRTVHPGGSITYVSPIFRASSDVERRRVESNLTFGDQGPKTYSLLSVVSIDLPPCAPDHSWQLEFDRLLALQYWCDLEGQEVPASIGERIEVLRAAPGTGLISNLFWPSPRGAVLKLAADFTMIPTYDGRRAITQADTFAIATSLFHKYRQGVPKKPRLVYRTYERTVISPESFQRFSDGVIQAAFLRAARQGEIAYGNCDESVSERMLVFLLGEVASAGQGGGPALMEYLISLLVGRLTLHPKHTREFLEKVIEQRLVDHFGVIARFLMTELAANDQSSIGGAM